MSYSGRFNEALSQVSFNCVQFAKYIREMNRTQIPNAVSAVLFEN
nr:MAG TPA: hypothetical protein [Caudoviricetes sp.]